MVAADRFVSERRHTFSSQTHLGIGLCTRFYRVKHIAVYRLDPHITAQRCLRKGNGCCGENIHILTLEDRVTLYVYFHQKISSGTSVHARLSFFTDPDALTVIDTGRDRYCDLLAAAGIALTTTVRTLLFHDLTGTAAVRTGLYISNHPEKRLLGIDHLAFTATFRTGFRCGSGLGSCSMTGGTFILQIQLQLFLTAENSLLKGDRHAGA